MTSQPGDWRRVAKQLRDEENPDKIMDLVFELERLLESEDNSRKRPQGTSPSAHQKVSNIAQLHSKIQSSI